MFIKKYQLSRYVTMFSVIGLSVGGFLFLSSSPAVHTVPIAHADGCTVPAAPTNVAVTFPNCTGSSCNFTQAKCTWDAISDATQYQVSITEVETGTSISSQQVQASVNTFAFPVAETNTYRCDVAATNACGAGATGTGSLLCKVDALVTVAPTATKVPVKKIPVTGPHDLVLISSIVGGGLILLGMMLFVF